MGTKPHRALVDLAQIGKRHDLETAGVGEDRQRPVHELMQATECGDAFGARTQHEMVGISENDVGARVAYRVRREPLHCSLRTDGHEGWRLDAAMRREDFAAPRRAISFEQSEGKAFGHYQLYIRAPRFPAQCQLLRSFPRKRESRADSRDLLRWVPAFAGTNGNLSPQRR